MFHQFAELVEFHFRCNAPADLLKSSLQKTESLFREAFAAEYLFLKLCDF
jgi:hypothetical protein